MNKSNFDELLNKMNDLYLNQAKIDINEDLTPDGKPGDISVAVVKDINSMMAPKESEVNFEFSKVVGRYLACSRVNDENISEFTKKSKIKITSVNQLVEMLNQENDGNNSEDAFIIELLLKVKEFEKEGKEKLNSPFFLLQSINHKRRQINLSRVRTNNFSKLDDLLIDKNKTCVIDNDSIDENFKSVVRFAKKHGYILEEKNNSIALSKNGIKLELDNASKVLASLQTIYQIVDSNIDLLQRVNEKLSETERIFGNNGLEAEQKRVNIELMYNVVKLAVCENIAMMTFDSETFKQVSKVLEYNIAQNLIDVVKIRNNNYIMNSIKDLIVEYSTICYSIANYKFEDVKEKIKEICGNVDEVATSVEELLLSTKTMQIDSKFDYLKLNNFQFKSVLDANNSLNNLGVISNRVAEKIKKQVNLQDGLTKEQKENLQKIKAEYEEELTHFNNATYTDSKDMEKLVNGYIYLNALVKVVDEVIDLPEKELDYSNENVENLQNINNESSVLNLAANIENNSTDEKTFDALSKSEIVKERVKEVIERNNEANQIVGDGLNEQEAKEQELIRKYEEKIRVLEKQEKELKEKINNSEEIKTVETAFVDEVTKSLKSRINAFGVNTMKTSINSLAGKNIDELNVLLGFAPKETKAEVTMIKNSLNLLCANEENEDVIKNVYNMFKFMNKTQTFEDMLKLKKGMENIFIPMLSTYLSAQAKKYRYDNMSDNHLANKVLEKSNLSLVEKMEECRIAEIDILAEKYEIGSYAYNEELEQIDCKYLGNGNNIGLMGQLKNNMLNYLMKEVVSNQIDKIVECEQKQQKYVLDEENCRMEFMRLFEYNKAETEGLTY